MDPPQPRKSKPKADSGVHTAREGGGGRRYGHTAPGDLRGRGPRLLGGGGCPDEALGGGGGGGVAGRLLIGGGGPKCAYHKWPNRIFPTLNSVLSHDWSLWPKGEGIWGGAPPPPCVTVWLLLL